MDADRLIDASSRLYTYLVDRHWDGSALVGPDPGIRFNARLGRFAKSYLGFLPWSDDMAYMQAQGYWVLDNWLLSDRESGAADVATACSDFVLASQRPAGHWDYPNPEWGGRVATVEGCFASLALLESHRRTGRGEYLEGAVRWHDYVESHVGFRNRDGRAAVNYFAGEVGTEGGGVPNNSTLYLWYLARLAEEAADDGYLARSDALVRWLADVQLDSGELPYAVGSADTPARTHFLCYQYNAFEFMDLVHYQALTGEDRMWPILSRLAGYLARGLGEAGFARYSCESASPTVLYYTAALAQALSQATRLGLGNHRSAVDSAYAWVLEHQRPDGNFDFYSTDNYSLLTDRRSYPRYLSMILHHLILEQRHSTPTQSDPAALDSGSEGQ